MNLHGAVAIPGLIDSHLHLLWQVQTCSAHPWTIPVQLEEVVEVLKVHVYRNIVAAGSWLQGFGWDQERFPGKEFPTRQDLDGSFPDTPIWLGRIDGHAAWANSAALRLVPALPQHDPQGGRIVRDPKTGQPTGIFTDTAMRFVASHVPRPTHAESAEALQLALASLARNGLTAIHDPGIGLEEIPLLKEAIDNGTFAIRSYAMVLANGNELGEQTATPETPIADYKGRLQVRAVKFFLDGALGRAVRPCCKTTPTRPTSAASCAERAEYKANASAWARAGWRLRRTPSAIAPTALSLTRTRPRATSTPPAAAAARGRCAILIAVVVRCGCTDARPATTHRALPDCQYYRPAASAPAWGVVSRR